MALPVALTRIQEHQRTITMAELFECTSINGMSLANRFVRSATWEGLADKDGTVTLRLIEMMVELARGEVGLIISGHAFVSPEGQVSPRQLAACADRFLPGLRDMVRAVYIQREESSLCSWLTEDVGRILS
jgi:2,4-dienoyl-CoA reductase-like NADH-dependent reductase (Old Yellow Enzyme family)